VDPKAKKNWMKDVKDPDSSALPILSDSELGVIYDGNPDQKSGVKILSLLITGNYAEAFNMMPMDKVRPQLLSGFEKLWPGVTKDMLGMEFYRYHPRAIAAWPPVRSRFDALSDEIRRPENHLYFAGDFTESSHSDGAFFSAARVVKQIMKAEKQ
jgi:monoamine oxidase